LRAARIRRFSIFIDGLQTPQTPILDFGGTAERDYAGGGAYTAVKHAYGK